MKKNIPVMILVELISDFLDQVNYFNFHNMINFSPAAAAVDADADEHKHGVKVKCCRFGLR